jgi:hypothetical protein
LILLTIDNLKKLQNSLSKASHFFSQTHYFLYLYIQNRGNMKQQVFDKYLRQVEPSARESAFVSTILGLKPTQPKAYIYQLLDQGKIVAHGANRNRTYHLATK